MAAASISRTSLFIRNFCKTTKTINTVSHSFSLPTATSSSNFLFQQARISTPRRLRREALFLNTLHPIHSATACLVSKLPTEVSTSTDGRFANYVSPI
ncbi:uncharacterized protein LOC113353149 isoform X2 [Papaver somniferum]|uniref:uncharacterized protein LOC113353149 isoform X2 n=1 Tax=Papaver somniferum TaxID=3469 RepID=UPI000E6F4E3A|nr:uncharacterized protein LOC113353149 isoform X2 [Papaver somniferum]